MSKKKRFALIVTGTIGAFVAMQFPVASLREAILPGPMLLLSMGIALISIALEERES